MRPDRAIVKKAIEDAAGNLSRAAGLLGCSRQTLYTWVYQMGLERLAGIRLDRGPRVDTTERQDTKAGNSEKKVKRVSNREPAVGPTIRLVTTPAPAVEVPINATMRIPESLWRRAKIVAIRRGVTVSQYVQACLETNVMRDESAETPAAKNGKAKDR